MLPGLRRTADVATSLAASTARLGSGMAVAGAGKRPAQELIVYDFEACPFCRKVREALSILDLDAMMYPCPKGGTRFREEVRRRGGKAQFPYLVDPNSGKEMYESAEIIAYLFERYGAGRPPRLLAGGLVPDVTAGLASAWRRGLGTLYGHDAAPA